MGAGDEAPEDGGALRLVLALGVTGQGHGKSLGASGCRPDEQTEQPRYSFIAPAYDRCVPAPTGSRTLSATGHLFAVIDDPADAPGAIAQLARTGVDPNEVTLLRGGEGAARLDATGETTGLLGRLRQALSFTMVDQMPDFILYEAALNDGRAVLAVPIRSDQTKGDVVRVLRELGAHFINLYGRFATEELDPWYGPELDIPGVLRR